MGSAHVAVMPAESPLRVAECDRRGRIGIEGDNRFAPRGLVMAFQAAWMGYSALMWEHSTARVRRLSVLLAVKKVAAGYRPSVAMVG